MVARNNPKRQFRPTVLGLEDRLVLDHGMGMVPAQVQDARLVQQDFAKFAQSYIQDVRTILLKADLTGKVDPSANRDAFNTQVDADLATLDASIAKDIANLVSPTDLATTIHNELVGTDANSLESRLTALATPTAPPSMSFRQFGIGAALAIGSTDQQIDRQVRAAKATAPTLQDLAKQDVKQIQQAYVTFAQAYFKDVRTILLAKGTDGTVNLTANRPNFDAQVAKDLTTLSNSVGTILGNLPSDSSLVTSVQAAINGSDPSSLQSKLAAIATPTNTNFFSVLLFQIDGGAAIARSYVSVAQQVLAFANGGGSTTTG